MNHIMLDLETMGTGNNAAIVAIGACAFDPHVIDHWPSGAWRSPTEQFYYAVSLESSVKAGLIMDAGTVLWWMGRTEAARRATFPLDATNIFTALGAFHGWVESVGGAGPKNVAVWGNGATFDNVIIRSAFKAVGLPVPWSYKNDMCYRTAANLLPEARRPKFEPYGTHHNALDDAIAQARHLQKVYRELQLWQ